MSRHAWRVKTYRSLGDLSDDFCGYAGPLEGRSPVTDCGPGRHDPSREGRCCERGELTAHADQTAEEVIERWYSQTDPRSPVNDRLTEVVVAVWRGVMDTYDDGVVTVPGLPASIEERPLRVPRATGVRYVTAQLLRAYIAVPADHQIAVAVREDDVPDDVPDDGPHPDPAGFAVEDGHEADVPLPADR